MRSTNWTGDEICWFRSSGSSSWTVSGRSSSSSSSLSGISMVHGCCELDNSELPLFHKMMLYYNTTWRFKEGKKEKKVNWFNKMWKIKHYTPKLLVTIKKKKKKKKSITSLYCSPYRHITVFAPDLRGFLGSYSASDPHGAFVLRLPSQQFLVRSFAFSPFSHLQSLQAPLLAFETHSRLAICSLILQKSHLSIM